MSDPLKISNDNLRVDPSAPISSPGPDIQASAPVDSGVSSIKKSEAVAAIMAPFVNVPLLITPSDTGDFLKVELMQKASLTVSQTTNQMIDKWSDNLKEIAQEVQDLINSPLYLELQKQRSEDAKGLSTVNSQNAAIGVQSPSVVSTVDRLQAFERVPPPSETGETSQTKDPTQVLIIPLALGMIVAGGIGLGHIDPISHSIDLIEGLQPIVATLKPENIVPLINLLVIGPYIQSWDEAVSRLGSKEGMNYQEKALGFSNEVIQIINDPVFILNTVVRASPGAEKLEKEELEKLTAVLKLILCGVALSFLYALEVGKLQNGKFGGLQPEEVRNILTGEFSPEIKEGIKPSATDEAVLRLLRNMHHQLSLLNQVDKTIAIEQILKYVYTTKDIEEMTSPGAIFENVLSSMKFDPRAHQEGLLT